MNTGRVIIRSPNRFVLVELVAPAMINNGAVSPTTLAAARVMPVINPGSAVGSTTWSTVRHLRTPSAYAASRSSSGTNRSICSAERTTIGIISRERATAPPNPIRTPGPRNSTNEA
jgi:hypothetical protein